MELPEELAVGLAASKSIAVTKSATTGFIGALTPPLPPPPHCDPTTLGLLSLRCSAVLRCGGGWQTRRGMCTPRRR